MDNETWDRINQLERRINQRQYYIDAISRLKRGIVGPKEKEQFDNYLLYNTKDELKTRISNVEQYLDETDYDIETGNEIMFEYEDELEEGNLTDVELVELKERIRKLQSKLESFVLNRAKLIKKRESLILKHANTYEKHEILKYFTDNEEFKALNDSYDSDLAELRALKPPEKRQKIGEVYFTELKVW